MSGKIRLHLRTNIVGYVALFIALSGSAYAIDGGLPGQDQVGSADIIDGEVFSADVRNNQIFSGDVRDDTFPNGGLVGADIADESLTGSDIGFGAVESADVADGSLDSADIADASLSGVDIADGGVDNAELAPNSVTGAEVFPSSLTGADVLSNSLTGADIGSETIGDDELEPSAVGASEVANASLGTAEFASSIPAVKATRTFNQGIVHGTFTALNFNSERYDTAGMHSNSANLSRLTAPVDGIYLVSAQIEWEENGSGSRILRLMKGGTNGVTLARDDRFPSSAPFNSPPVNLSTVARFAAGEFVVADVQQSSGGNLAILQLPERSPELSMTWLAPGP